MVQKTQFLIMSLGSGEFMCMLEAESKVYLVLIKYL